VDGAGTAPGSGLAGGAAGGAGSAGVGAGGFLLKNFSMGKKYIRIVAGQYRRTPIAVADVEGLRPTPDRVRETLFNWLHHFWGGDFATKSVLDLFSGSGALGFEAASRGARHVQLVERSKPALAGLKEVRTRLDAHQVDIAAADALDFLRTARCRYDLVLLDPPFGQGWLPRLWPLVPDVLAEGGLVYVESGEALQAPPGFESLRHDKAGAVHYQLMQFAALRN
jgi:16S rRNA (guanine(966)-N(2))-methyltransferase RsmD